MTFLYSCAVKHEISPYPRHRSVYRASERELMDLQFYSINKEPHCVPYKFFSLPEGPP